MFSALNAVSAEKTQGRIALGGFGRVKHWQSGTMVPLWNAAGVLEAENGFRKGGYRAIPNLVEALRTRDIQSTRTGVLS